MATELTTLKLRIQTSLYEQASDVALVYDLSLNRFLEQCIQNQVGLEFKVPGVVKAIERMHEARAHRAAAEE